MRYFIPRAKTSQKYAVLAGETFLRRLWLAFALLTLVHVIAMDAMSMAVVNIIDMIAVLHRFVAATVTMLMVMVLMDVAGVCRRRVSLRARLSHIFSLKKPF